MPSDYHTDRFKKALNFFVTIETWDDMVFEFAHFSDEEISKAMMEVYRAHRGSLTSRLTKYRVRSETELLSKLELILSRIRPKGSIEKSIMNDWDYSPSKPKIAEILWPSLEENIKIADEQENIQSIPIARTILKAWEIAARSHRKDVVMPY